MNFSPKRKTITFIVRVWAEYLHEQPPRWCGVIEPVGFAERIQFTKQEEMVDLIQQNTYQQIKKEHKS